MLINVYILVCQNIIALVTIAETVNKNLIHNRTLCPVRCLKARCDCKCKIIIMLVHSTKSVVVAWLKTTVYLKIVSELLVCQMNLYLIEVKFMSRICKLHLSLCLIIAEDNLVHIGYTCPETNSHITILLRLGRVNIPLCSITVQQILIHDRFHTVYINKLFISFG